MNRTLRYYHSAIQHFFILGKVSTLSNALRNRLAKDKSLNHHSPDPEALLPTTHFRSDEVTNKTKIASPAFDVIFMTGNYSDMTDEASLTITNDTTKEPLERLNSRLEETEQTNITEIRGLIEDNNETAQK